MPNLKAGNVKAQRNQASTMVYTACRPLTAEEAGEPAFFSFYVFGNRSSASSLTR
jgi:hypothetical protein